MEIAPGVHRIGPTKNGQLKGSYSQCYLFDDGKSLTLVDAGYDNDGHTIIEYLWALGRTPDDLTDIALTHAHRSHLGGVAALKTLNPKVRIYAHKFEAPIIAGRRGAQPVSLFPLLPLKLVPLRILTHLGIPKHRPCTVDEELDDHDDGRKIGPLEVLFTPGHTPGCLSFFWRERGVLALGDIVATWPKFDAGWPGFNLDEALYQQSLQRLVALAPKVVCPGHGLAVTENTAERLEGLLKGPYWPASTS